MEKGTARVGSRRMTERKSKTVKAAKPLGKRAMKAILHNEEVVDAYLARLERGDVPDTVRIGRVTSIAGGGRFYVTLLAVPGLLEEESLTKPVSLAGTLIGTRKMAGNPAAETAVHRDGYVLVHKVLTGKYNTGKVAEIIGVFTGPEARYARDLLKITSEAASENNGGFFFNYGNANVEAEAARAVRHEEFRRELMGAAAAAGRTNRASSGNSAGVTSSGDRLSAAANWAELEEEEKSMRRAAKVTRKKERRRAKKAAAGGGGGA